MWYNLPRREVKIMDFDIHKVKTFKETSDYTEAEKYIKNGWTFLNVCEVRNGQTSDRCYILGSCEPPKPPNSNSVLSEVLSEIDNQ
jgi:hypothetical protein